MSNKLETNNRQITKEFSSFFHLKGFSLIFEIIKRLKGFLLYLHINNKYEEFLSFLAWEIFHILKLNKNSYINFNNNPCLKLSDEQLLKIGEINQGFNGGICERVHLPWKLVYIVNNEEMWGVISPRLHVLVKSSDEGNSYTDVFSFPSIIDSLYVSRHNKIFVCCAGKVYKSKDNGATFDVVLKLSTSESYFLHDYGITEDEKGTIFIGEYGNIWSGKNGWKNIAFIYLSKDNGETFNQTDFFIKQGANKHIHIIRFCSYFKQLFLTDGDNKKRIWINESMQNFTKKSSGNEHGWMLMNKRHINTGGYLSVISLTDGILFGSDYLGGTNFLIKIRDSKKLEKKILPDPIRRNPISNLVNVKSSNGNQIWVNSRNDLGSKHSKSMLFYSNDNGETWLKFIEYDGIKCDIVIKSASLNPTKYFFASIINKNNNDIIGTLKFKIN
ncbi:WD40/YVTN/BNR-like repeat-containing protein [Peribacillus butanolivorans]|uniref:WD40/YVTN/BNR-like repeat-containing protein n=1 Tax=Peribacillus butanolivorans TaxID=421767 RepID=UPI003666ADC9